MADFYHVPHFDAQCDNLAIGRIAHVRSRRANAPIYYIPRVPNSLDTVPQAHHRNLPQERLAGFENISNNDHLYIAGHGSWNSTNVIAWRNSSGDCTKWSIS